jgi:uncharacterized membrane protein
MTKQEWIKNEILTWQSEGIINKVLAETLIGRYKTEVSKVSWGAIIVGAFGALMIGLGIIALFAANWDSLNRPARAVVAVTPLIVCALIGIIASFKNVKAMAFWEPLGILWCVSTVAAACLVAQTYQVGGSVPGLVLLVALLTLPIAWLTKSVAIMMSWPLFAIIWAAASEDFEGKSWSLLVKSFALMVLSLPAFIAFLRRKPYRAALVAGLIVTGLLYSLGAAIMTLKVVPFRFWKYPEASVMIFWGLSAIVLGLGAKFKLPTWPMIATIVISGAATTTVSQEIWIFGLSVLIAVSIAWYGIWRVKLSYMNIGAALFLWLLLAKFFESKISFTIKGIVLICSGVALTLLNVAMTQFKKRRVK